MLLFVVSGGVRRFRSGPDRIRTGDDEADRPLVNGDDPRRHFADRLRQLWQLARNPSQKAIAVRAGLGEDGAKRLSDWLRGDNVPRDPQRFAKVIAALIERVPASKRDGAGLLVDPANWMVLVSRAQVAPKRLAAAEPTTQDHPARSWPVGAPPRPPQGVVGRGDTLDEIRDMLWAAGATRVAVFGGGGRGKTTVAAETARRAAADACYDRVLWAELGPKPEPVKVRHMLEGWGRALGIELLTEPDVEACTNRLRHEASGRRLLLVIDDVWDVRDAHPFLLGGPSNATLLTTRDRRVAYTLATTRFSYSLDLLTPAAALELLELLAPAAVDQHRLDVERLCRRMGYLPLGLTLAGGLLAVESHVPGQMQSVLQALNGSPTARLDLAQDERRLGIDDDTVSVRAILGLSVSRLTGEQQDWFAMLASLEPDPATWDVAMAATLWKCPEPQAAATVSLFVQRGIVEPRGDAFWMHAMTRDYAWELLRDRFPE